jgi:hypothetical protein
MKTLICLLFIISGVCFSYGQVNIQDQFKGATHFYNSTKIPFRLFTPNINPADGKVGLVLYLSGITGLGNDNIAQLIEAKQAATYWTKPIVQSEYPCFVLVPQCPVGSYWAIDTVYENIVDLIDSLTNACPIDSMKLYVTGWSMGGTGTWCLMDKYPEKFAACAPVSGLWNPTAINKIKNIPVWNFHGTNDTDVPTDNSRVLVFTYEKLGYYFFYPQCQYSSCNHLTDKQFQEIVDGPYDHLYSEYYLVGHNVCDKAYTDPYLYKWMLCKVKRTEGVISLKGFDSYGQISGESVISWAAQNPNDSVEIWLSSDLENSWIKLGKRVASSGTFTFDSKLVKDCAFGTIKLLTRDSKGYIIGTTKSVPQAINNEGNSPPFLKISGDCMLRSQFIDYDWIEVKMIVGDAENDPLNLRIFYSADDGKTFSKVDSITIKNSINYQTYRLELRELIISKSARIKIELSDDSLTSRFMSEKFFNRNGHYLSSPIINEDFRTNLDQNHPNPFNSVTTIKWQLTKTSKVTVKVLDIVGRTVVTLVDEQRPQGKYETQFNAGALPKGIYFCQLKAGEFMQTRKMILMK